MINQTVRHIVFVIGLVTVMGCGKPPATQPPSTTSNTPPVSTPVAAPVAPAIPLGEVVVLRQARLQFRPGLDYEELSKGLMYRHKNGRGQINIGHMLGTVDDNSRELSANLQSTGKKGVQTEDLPATPSGLTRKLIRHEQTPSQTDEWALLIGKERWTSSIKVLVPAGATAEMTPMIRAMLLSADAIPGDTRPLDSVAGFHLAGSTMLKPAQLTLWVDYTLSGAMNLKTADEPILTMNPQVPSNGKMGEEAADEQLKSIRLLSNAKVTSRQPIELAGRSGFETEATGLKGKAEVPVIVYQLVLFTPAGKPNFGDLTVYGTVGTEFPDKDAIFAEFRRMARGLTNE